MSHPEKYMQQVRNANEHTMGTGVSAPTLYDRHARAIFAYVRLHTSSPEDAEDVMLEVFMAALEHNNLAGWTEEAQLRWLHRVAKNKLTNIYRHARRHPTIALEHVAETLYDDELRSPEAAVLRQERYQQLHAAISRLSELQQQVLQLRYGHGLRFAEIAILLNKREAALRQLLSRTLSSLRASYAAQQWEGKGL